MTRDPSKETEFAQFEARFGKEAVNQMIDDGVSMLTSSLFDLAEPVNPDDVIVTAEALPKEVMEDISSNIILRFRALFPRTDKATGRHIPPTVIIWGEIPGNITGSIWKPDPTCNAGE